MPDLVIRFFSSDLWLAAFIISIAYLFFRSDISGKRAILATFAAFLLVINSVVIKLFSSLGENATFYRHLWAIPTVAIIVTAIVDIVRVIQRWYMKIPFVLAITVFLWLANQEYIRCREQIISYDGAMVQEDVIALADGFEKVKNESKKNIIYVMCPSGYSIPYGNMQTELSLYCGFLKVRSSNILNSTIHNGEVELMSDSPDIPYIMSMCCSKGIDYVIIVKYGDTESLYSAHGYIPVFSTDKYIVYPCFGYYGFLQDENNWGQLIYRTYYDRNGNPTVNENGYSTVRYEYDNRGNKIKENYFDDRGVPCCINSGYSSVHYDYDNKKNCIRETFCDNNNLVCEDSNGYAITERKYNHNSLPWSICYRNKDGDLVQSDGCYEIRKEYYPNKTVKRISYYDKNGQLMKRFDTLYAIREIEYDNHGFIIGEKYYDTEQKPWGSFSRILDDKGNILKETYYDKNGQLCFCDSGYSIYKSVYDGMGRMVCEQYYDVDENLINIEAGYAEIKYQYNDFGQVIKVSYWGENGNPVRNRNGYHEVVKEYDEFGKCIKEIYLDEQGKEI